MFPATVRECSLFPTASPALYLIFVIIAVPAGVRSGLTVVLKYVSLVISYAAPLFMYLVATFMSSLEKKMSI